VLLAVTAASFLRLCQVFSIASLAGFRPVKRLEQRPPVSPNRFALRNRKVAGILRLPVPFSCPRPATRPCISLAVKAIGSVALDHCRRAPASAAEIFLERARFNRVVPARERTPVTANEPDAPPPCSSPYACSSAQAPHVEHRRGPGFPAPAAFFRGDTVSIPLDPPFRFRTRIRSAVRPRTAAICISAAFPVLRGRQPCSISHSIGLHSYKQPQPPRLGNGAFGVARVNMTRRPRGQESGCASPPVPSYPAQMCEVPLARPFLAGQAFLT